MTRAARCAVVGSLGALVSSLLLLMMGCSLINEAPTAVIVAVPLTGTSPLPVEFDASKSTDRDGEITMTSWDFGDGVTSELEKVTHTYYVLTERTMYTVTLTVADNGFATDRVTQTIEVFPNEDGGGGAGDPVARIVADRVIGRTPLTVSFDGSTSQGGAGSIIQYQWHFGDGKQGTGSQVFHEYKPGETEEFTVTLYVWNDKGERAADQEKIVVIVPTDESGDDNPTADIEMSTPLLLYVQDDDPETPITIPTRYEVTFDPRGSRADAGHRLDYYVWDFGDGQSEVRRLDDLVTHLYELTPPSRTHIVRLTVYDNYGLEGTTTANLTLSQPVAED